MRLQMIASADSDKPILAWTQIPVLEETTFQAEMVAGCPALSPLGAAPASRARGYLSLMD